jgi:hypothetical protein
LNNQFTGNIGGPLGKRASVFLDVERRAVDDNAVINAIGIDSTFQSVPERAALNAPDRYSNLSGRMDYQLTQNNTLVGRFDWWDASKQNAGVGGFSLASTAYRHWQTDDTLQLTETAVLSPAAINEMHFQFTGTNTSQTSQDQSPAIAVLDSFNGGGAQIPYASNVQNHFETQNSTSLSFSTHLMRFGARLRTLSLTDATARYFNGQYIFAAEWDRSSIGRTNRSWMLPERRW